MTDTLYIIGNGFDLHHGIPSAYSDFGRYLRDHDRETADLVTQYFHVDDDFWSDFEARLASFDSDTLVEDAAQFLVSYGADDWSDAYHHDYQFEIDRVVQALSGTMQKHFTDWVRQLPIPDVKDVAHLRANIDPTARFLNFNYTPVLQRLYGIPEEQILHIHGSVADPDAALVLGHGWEPQDLDPYRFEDNPEDADPRVIEGIRLVDDYFKNTFKPTQRILQDNRRFFEDLGSVRQINVMGHSLAEVDKPYFDAVIQHTQATGAHWKVSYYVRPDGSSDLDDRHREFSKFRINPDLVEFAQIHEF